MLAGAGGHPPSRPLALGATDSHEAVDVLRAWLADQLRLRPGDAVLDVGCGPGSAAADLGDLVGPTGRVVGIDPSAALVEAARRSTDRPNVTFTTGDATALDFADCSLDAYRSERTFQWLSRPDRALGEAVRVLRPGGRLGVVDPDWGTLAVDHPDPELCAQLAGRLWGVQPNPLVGRQLPRLAREAGLCEVGLHVETIVATSWNPATPGIAGLPPFKVMAEGAVEAGAVRAEQGAAWLAGLAETAATGSFFLSVSLIGVSGTKPPTPRA